MNPQFKKGVLELIVLESVHQKDMYGYEMIDTLRGRSNQVFDLKAGTLYPLLHTLESRGYVNSYEETASGGKSRRYYSLTREGKKYAAQKKAQWQEYQAAVANVLARDAKRPRPVMAAGNPGERGQVCYGI